MKKYFAILLIILTLTFSACDKPISVGTWSFADTGTQNTFFELNFVSPQTAWLTGWFEKGPEATEGWQVLQTNDGGKTWTPMVNQAEQKIKYVYFINEKTGWALNLTQDILATSDGGTTWSITRTAGKSKIKYNYKNTTAPTELPDPINKIKFVNEKTGWAWGGGKKDSAVEQEGIFLCTSDSGKTWERVEYPFASELKTLFFLNEKFGWASDTKSGVYKTLDGGKTWQKQPDDMTRPSINGIFFISEKKGTIVGDSYIGLTEDGGNTWKPIKVKDTYLNDVYWIDENNAWAVGDKGKLMVSQNGGQRWEHIKPLLDEPDLANITKVKFLDINSGWAYGNNGLLLHYEMKKAE